MTDDANPGVHWLDPSENPWPVPVLDVRSVTLGMMSTSRNPEAALNAMSWGQDDGSDFADATPSTPRSAPVGLRYRGDRMLADGVLFTPEQMEHKWALFSSRNRILFVRSWARELIVAASTRVVNGLVEVETADGVFTEPDEPPELTAAIIDFILRTHVLQVRHPAPLIEDPGEDLERAALWCFMMFGNRAWCATHHRFRADPPDAVLRSHSLFHISIARHDLAAAQAQLDAGVPIDLLAGDGLSALHWALSGEGTDRLAWLVARGLDVDVRSGEGATALMNAAQQGDDERIVWLLDHGSDIDAGDNRGFTSLHRAAEVGHPQTVRLLLNRGATRTCEAEGYTPRALAEMHDRSEIIAMLDGVG